MTSNSGPTDRFGHWGRSGAVGSFGRLRTSRRGTLCAGSTSLPAARGSWWVTTSSRTTAASSKCTGRTTELLRLPLGRHPLLGTARLSAAALPQAPEGLQAGVPSKATRSKIAAPHGDSSGSAGTHLSSASANDAGSCPFTGRASTIATRKGASSVRRLGGTGAFLAALGARACSRRSDRCGASRTTRPGSACLGALARELPALLAEPASRPASGVRLGVALGGGYGIRSIALGAS